MYEGKTHQVVWHAKKKENTRSSKIHQRANGDQKSSRLGITEHPQQLYTAFEGLCMEFVHFDKFHGLEIDLWAPHNIYQQQVHTPS